MKKIYDAFVTMVTTSVGSIVAFFEFSAGLAWSAAKHKKNLVAIIATLACLIGTSFAIVTNSITVIVLMFDKTSRDLLAEHKDEITYKGWHDYAYGLLNELVFN